MPGRQKPDEAADPGEAAAEAVEQAQPAENAPRLPVSRFLGPDGRTLTGYESHVIAGALHDVDDKELTVAEVKAAAKAWLKADVKEA